VILMDDIGVPISGTRPMRLIAPVLLSPMRPADEIAVVRLSRPRDEAFGDVASAGDRVDSYSGGGVPFSSRDTPEVVLGAVRAHRGAARADRAPAKGAHLSTCSVIPYRRLHARSTIAFCRGHGRRLRRCRCEAGGG